MLLVESRRSGIPYKRFGKGLTDLSTAYYYCGLTDLFLSRAKFEERIRRVTKSILWIHRPR